MRPSNLILDQIEPEVLAAFQRRLEDAPLDKGAVLHDIGEPVRSVWFPLTGLIGLASETIGGESVSGGLIGWDGAYGAFEACGSRKSFTRATVQVPGLAKRVRASIYREMFDASAGLRTAVHKHVEALMVEARQIVACNAIHPVDQRLCRALLDVYDRSKAGERLPLTQETLANMLGVQRTTIAVAISALQRAGLLRSGRGAIDLLDPEGLQAAACSCRLTIAFAHSEIYSTTSEACDS